jgi:hypothetical protein
MVLRRSSLVSCHEKKTLRLDAGRIHTVAELAERVGGIERRERIGWRVKKSVVAQETA